MALSSLWETTIGIWIYDIPTYNVLLFLTGHAGYVTAIEYSPDREILASGSSDTTIRLWNLHTGKNFAVLRGHKGSVNNIAFLSDSKTLVSNSSRERKILFWNLKIDLAKEHKAIAPEKSYPGNAFSMALSPDGETVAIGNVHPTVILWNMKLGLTKAMLDGHTWVPSDTQYAYPGSIHSLAFFTGWRNVSQQQYRHHNSIVGHKNSETQSDTETKWERCPYSRVFAGWKNTCKYRNWSLGSESNDSVARCCNR